MSSDNINREREHDENNKCTAKWQSDCSSG